MSSRQKHILSTLVRTNYEIQKTNEGNAAYVIELSSPAASTEVPICIIIY